MTEATECVCICRKIRQRKEFVFAFWAWDPTGFSDALLEIKSSRL